MGQDTVSQQFKILENVEIQGCAMEMETDNLVKAMKEKAQISGTIVCEISSMEEAIGYAVNLSRKKK